MRKALSEIKEWEWLTVRVSGKFYQQYWDAIQKLETELERKVYTSEIIVPTLQAFIKSVEEGNGRNFLVEGRKPGKQSGKA